LRGDVALIEAWRADRWGNLTYRGSGRNFNPVMVTAAKTSVVQVQEIVDIGGIDPEHVVTPSLYVNRLVEIPYTYPYPAIEG
jgi:3-oxoadipate CoA-transferase alpha subunit